MKTKLTILLILITFSGFSQFGETFEYNDTIAPQIARHRVVILTAEEARMRHLKNDILNYYNKYKRECLDTIKTIQYEDQFIINHGPYKEMVTTNQLNERGYVYSYRFVTNTDPFEFDYYFIKKLDLPGFMDWLNKQ